MKKNFRLDFNAHWQIFGVIKFLICISVSACLPGKYEEIFKICSRIIIRRRYFPCNFGTVQIWPWLRYIWFGLDYEIVLKVINLEKTFLSKYFFSGLRTSGFMFSIKMILLNWFYSKLLPVCFAQDEKNQIWTFWVACIVNIEISKWYYQTVV